MKKLALTGLLAFAGFALTTAVVYGAPAPKKPGAPSKQFPPKSGKAPTKPVSETVYCPSNVPVTHAVKAPNGWHALTSIRNYALGLCLSDDATFVSGVARTLSCYYCDAQGTQKIRIDRPFPPGRSQCTKAGRYKFTCR